MKRLFSGVVIDFRGLHADGDQVIVECLMTDNWLNGCGYQLDDWFTFGCRGERIARVREYMDTMAGFRRIFSRGHPLAGMPPR